MADKTLLIDGRIIDLDEQGYLIDDNQWDERVAEALAKELAIGLTKKHWQVIEYLRQQHAGGNDMTMRRIGQSDVVSIKELYDLFPGGPLKYAAKIAGLPKPTSCI